MLIDYDYLKDEIFTRFLNSDKTYLYFGSDIFDHYDEDDPETGLPTNKAEKFIFHWKILEDQHFVEMQSSSERTPFRFGASGQCHYSDQAVRLTAKGQEFAENLSKAKSEWISKVKDYGIGVASETLKSFIITGLTS